MRRTTQTLEMISQATHDCIWDWNLQTGQVWRDGKVNEIFGCPASEMVPDIDWWRSRLKPEQESHIWESLQAALASQADRWTEEYQLRRCDDSYISVSDRGWILRDGGGRAVRVLGGMVDISAERIAEQRLLYNAQHDSLTGLPNRDLLLARLKEILSRTSPLAVLFLDIDGFKSVNDNFGHQVGDKLLIEAGNRLTQYLREGDLAARYGSDEFVVLLEGVGGKVEAVRIAERILHGLAVPFHLEGIQVNITSSIGAALSSEGPPEYLLRHAELAMYQAKREGRGQVKNFDPALERLMRTRAKLETDLRQSFDDGSLRLYYQPIISLHSGELVSFEALLRWVHPDRGLVYPAEILPAAENAGLSVKLGQWVLRQTCDRLHSWQQTGAAHSLHMNVNLSGADFIRPTLVEEVKRLLSDTEIPGENLVVEVTETTIMESNVDAARRLGHLRDLGIRLAIDDFGKGHSSLGRLQDFPISILKIDAAFVQQIRGGRHQILDAIIALAHELDLEVTAEGVESADQLRYLRQKGVAHAQGLLFAPALTAEDSAELLVQTPWMLDQYVSPGLSNGFAAS